jgi:hypothetical protein
MIIKIQGYWGLPWGTCPPQISGPRGLPPKSPIFCEIVEFFVEQILHVGDCMTAKQQGFKVLKDGSRPHLPFC